MLLTLVSPEVDEPHYGGKMSLRLYGMPGSLFPIE